MDQICKEIRALCAYCFLHLNIVNESEDHTPPENYITVDSVNASCSINGGYISPSAAFPRVVGRRGYVNVGHW